MFIRYLITIFFILLANFSFASSDSLRLEGYIKASVFHVKNNHADSVFVYVNKAAVLSKKLDYYNQWIKSFILPAYYDRRKKNGGEIAFQLYQKAFDNLYRSPSTKKEWKSLANLYTHRAAVYRINQGDFYNALRDYEDAEEIYTKHISKEHFDLSRIVYTQLGNINTRLGDYEKALFYLQKAKKIAEVNNRPNYASRACNDIGIVYRSLQQHDKAIQEYKYGLTDKNLNAYSKAILYENLALEYYHTKVYDQAESNSKKALNWLEKSEDSNKKNHELVIFKNLALIARANKDYESSIQYLNNAVEMAVEISPGVVSRQLGKLNNEKGYTYLAAGELMQALSHFQKALQYVLPDFKPKDEFENPNPQSFYAENTIMESLEGKAKSLVELAKVKQDNSIVKKAISTYELIFEVEQQLNIVFYYQSSKLEVLRESKERIAEMIGLCYEAFKEEGDQYWAKKALQFSETSKARLLLYGIHKNKAYQAVSHLDTLVLQERALQQEFIDIRSNQLQLNSLKNSLLKDSLEETLTQQWIKVQQQIKQLDQEMEKKYPQEFYATRFYQSFDLPTFQKELKKEQSLIEYFIEGEDHQYVFVLQKEAIHFQKLDVEQSLPDLIRQLQIGVYGYHLSETPNDSLYQKCNQAFDEAAFSLYQALIQPIEAKLKKNLIIIPDAELTYIPFELLLEKEVKRSGRFKDYAFFLHSKTIRYAYAMTLLQEMQEKEIPFNKHRILAVAPAFQKQANGLTFNEKRSGLGALKYNVEEIEQLAQYYETDYLTAHEATRFNFLQKAPDYSVLHLATHGKADDALGERSFIAFTMDSTNQKESYLYQHDLNQLQLSCEMVVLSACESGIGELQKGEGIVSMASGFSYAGAKSIITTLWAVNDQTTSQIMTDFYKGLKEDLVKDEALRNAKQQYLHQSVNLNAHPYYWAGFIAIGDMSPLKTSNNWSMWMIGALLFFVGFAGYFWKKRT